MSMSYADHVYDNNWEKAADEKGNIDYEKLCEIYHDAFEEYESAQEVKIEKLEARCKELEAELSTTVSNAMLAGKLEMQRITELEEENRILKAKLEKALEIIDWSKNWLQNVTLEKKLRTYTPEEHVNYLMKELDSIE